MKAPPDVKKRLAELARAIDQHRTHVVEPAPHENPPRSPRTLPGQLGLLGGAIQQVARTVASSPVPAPPVLPPPPDVRIVDAPGAATRLSRSGDPRAPRHAKPAPIVPGTAVALNAGVFLRDRFTVQQHVKGFEVFDRISGRVLEDPDTGKALRYPDRDEAQTDATQREVRWRRAFEAALAHHARTGEFPFLNYGDESSERAAALRAALGPELLYEGIADNAAKAKVIAPEIPKRFAARRRGTAGKPLALPENEEFAEGAREEHEAKRKAHEEAQACAVTPADALAGEATLAPLQRHYEVPAENMGKVRDLLAKWQKKAAKLGQYVPRITEGTPVIKELGRSYEIEGAYGGTELATRTVKMRVVPVTIEGSIPKLNGWVFVATLTPLGAENVVNSTGDIPIPVRFRGRINTCDHCRTTRKRAETFLVYNEKSRVFAQVGRSCVQDFLPGQDVDGVLGAIEYLKILKDALDEASAYGGGDIGGASSHEMALSDYLPHVAMFVRLNGYRSTKMEGSTRETALTNLRAEFHKDPKIRRTFVAPTAGDVAMAAEALAFWRANTEQSDLARDLQTIARAEVVPFNVLGKAAWMIPGYTRESTARAEKAAKPESRHVGEVGKRMRLVVNVEKLFAVSSDTYGDKTIYAMRDDAGNSLRWFSDPGKLEAGKRYVVVATIKKHGEYKGEQQTDLSRVDVERELAAGETLAVEQPKAKKAKGAPAAKPAADKPPAPQAPEAKPYKPATEGGKAFLQTALKMVDARSEQGMGPWRFRRLPHDAWELYWHADASYPAKESSLRFENADEAAQWLEGHRPFHVGFMRRSFYVAHPHAWDFFEQLNQRGAYPGGWTIKVRSGSDATAESAGTSAHFVSPRDFDDLAARDPHLQAVVKDLRALHAWQQGPGLRFGDLYRRSDQWRVPSFHAWSLWQQTEAQRRGESLMGAMAKWEREYRALYGSDAAETHFWSEGAWEYGR